MAAKDYIKFTPLNTSILDSTSSCLIRYPGEISWKYPYPTLKECYGKFTIEKYLHRGMMCYHFIVDIPANETLQLEEYSLAPLSSGTIFKVFMDRKEFGDVDFYSTFLHGSKTSRLYDSIFTPKKFYFLDINSTSDYLNVDVTYSAVKSIIMPPPYDTMCLTIPGFRTNAEYYFLKIRQKIIDQLKHVDTFLPVYEPLSYPLLGPESFANRSIYKAFDDIRNSVKRPPPTCDSLYYISKLSVGKSNLIAISVLWPEDYTISVQHIEDQGLIDYVVYVCSSIGIWFGLSFCSLIDVCNKLQSKAEAQEKTVKCDVRIKALFEYLKLSNSELKRRADKQEMEINRLKSRQGFH